MTQARSLHIGINSVDPKQYNNWSGKLVACENDARDMHGIASSLGYDATLMLTRDATYERVVAAIRASANVLKAGDVFLLSIACHGAQIPDTTGDEKDGQDETWVLFDRMIIDDELSALWCGFAEGVRVVVVSDSCHSGTVTRASEFKQLLASRGGSAAVPRVMPDDVAFAVFNAQRRRFAIAKRAASKVIASSGGAAVLLLSACQDYQLAGDGVSNGAFTGQLKAAWRNGAFRGTYAELMSAVINAMKRVSMSQVPRISHSGPDGSDFSDQAAFLISNRTATIHPNGDMNMINYPDDSLDGPQFLLRCHDMGGMSDAAFGEFLRGPVCEALVEIHKQGKVFRAQAEAVSSATRSLDDGGIEISVRGGELSCHVGIDRGGSVSGGCSVSIRF